jgi:hypothetical protein
VKYVLPEDVSGETILNYFQAKPQQLKAIEELSECCVRLAKDLADEHTPLDPDKNSSYDATVEEIADATIMLRQMRLLYGWEAVDRAIERKINRTLKRIDELKI